MQNKINVGLIGAGTVGGGTYKILKENFSEISRKTGKDIVVFALAEKDIKRAEAVVDNKTKIYEDAFDLVRDKNIHIVVELIGGTGISKDFVEEAIKNSKHIVTANKALIAMHGEELVSLANHHNVNLCYEAAVAGGIPIIKSIREGLAANKIEWVAGILNGTTNYILTEMKENNLTFDVALKQAQELGFAEADPTYDIEGVDAAHKLALLSTLAFGTRVSFDDVYTEGIRHVSLQDIDYAEEFGYRIKLLGSARMTEHGLEQRVYPCMVTKTASIAHVESAYNAVVARCDFLDDTIYQGRGAGAGPTASAVVADIIDIARGFATTTFGVPAGKLSAAEAAPIERHRGAYYVRLMVDDKPGVIADISGAFRDESVSIGSMLQRARSQTEAVPIVLNTHVCEEAAMRRTLNRIEALDSVVEAPTMIRIESLV